MRDFLLWVTAGSIGRAIVFTVAIAAIGFHYLSRTRETPGARSWKGFFSLALPIDLLKNPWTRTDGLYYVIARCIRLLIFPVTSAVAIGFAALIQSSLQSGFGGGPMFQFHLPILLAFLVVALLVHDFASFYLHMLQHRIPLLWEFHKVHHAPESLIPLTAHRIHPGEDLLDELRTACTTGLLVGAFAWTTNQPLDLLILDTVLLRTLINIITLAPLQHSHIDMRLGRLESVFLSPAHHRLHHSAEPDHWDKNFAGMFPFWDRIWRTLLPPPPIDSYRIGLPDGQSASYRTALASYFLPFYSTYARARTEGWATVLSVGALHNQAADTALLRPNRIRGLVYRVARRVALALASRAPTVSS